jgi:hypothetical protein
MAVPVALRRDYDGTALRVLARTSKDGPQTRRLLALAAIYEGASRTEAARIGAVTLQGGFKRSSQHPEGGGCDEHSKAPVGSVWTSAVAVTGSATCGGAR